MTTIKLSDTQKQIVRALIAVARAAWNAMDDTECSGKVGEEVYTIPEESVTKLSNALDVLDNCPAADEISLSTGPANAEGWLLPDEKEKP